MLRLFAASEELSTLWIAAVTGALVWLVFFLNLPKPMWVYVVGHEFTHALWNWAFGGRLKSFKATSKGGYVVITKNHFLITLAPYFFPLYTVLWMTAVGLFRFLLGWKLPGGVAEFGVGVTYAFHVTLTWHVLQLRQPDLEIEGVFFSAVVIWLGNVLVLLAAWWSMTQAVPGVAVLKWLVDDTTAVVRGIGRIFSHGPVLPGAAKWAGW